MSVQGFLLKTYFTLEDKYYNLMDFFEKIKIPVYEFFIHPLENRRIPSFPVFILILLIILLILIGFVFKSPSQVVSLTLSISGPQTAQVNVFQGSTSIKKTLFQGSFYVFNVSKGEVLIKASSDGFAENITTLKIESDVALTIKLHPLSHSQNNASIPSLSGIQIP